MLKKTISYTDYNDVERTEDFYFNLSRAEIAEMELGVDGGLSSLLQKIVKNQDNKELMAHFKNLILRAYGEKSPDGKRFIKSKELSEAFLQSDAYDKFFFDMLMDANQASEFVNGIMPKDLIKQKETTETAKFVTTNQK